MVEWRRGKAHSAFSFALGGRCEGSSSSKTRPWKASRLQLIARSKPAIKMDGKSFMKSAHHFPFPERNEKHLNEGRTLDGRRRRFTADAAHCLALRNHELEPVHVEVDDGSRIQREDLTHHQAADDADSKRAAQFRTSSGRQRQRQTT